MDLHGLHVNEAITQLANHISHARTSSQPAPLSVIVGTGSHTKVTPFGGFQSVLRLCTLAGVDPGLVTLGLRTVTCTTLSPAVPATLNCCCCSHPAWAGVHFLSLGRRGITRGAIRRPARHSPLQSPAASRILTLQSQKKPKQLTMNII